MDGKFSDPLIEVLYSLVQIPSLVHSNGDKSQYVSCVFPLSFLAFSQREGGRVEIPEDSASSSVVRGTLGTFGL